MTEGNALVPKIPYIGIFQVENGTKSAPFHYFFVNTHISAM